MILTSLFLTFSDCAFPSSLAIELIPVELPFLNASAYINLTVVSVDLKVLN